MKFYHYPRWIAWLYAHLNGYFWSDCPICGKMFGGHETASYGFMDSWDSGQCVCWLCGERARKQNEDFMKKNPPPPRVAYYPYKKGEEK